MVTNVEMFGEKPRRLICTGDEIEADGGAGGTHVDEEGVRELELFVGHAEGEHGIPRGDVLCISGHGAKALYGGIDMSVCRELLELQGEVVRAEELSRTWS